MGQQVSYKCQDCGFEFENDGVSEFYIDNEYNQLHEFLPLIIPNENFSSSKIKGRIYKTYCNNCKRNIKVYSIKESSKSDAETIDIVKSGDIIILNLPFEVNNINPVKGNLSVLWEDEYIIVYDKPYDMPVHPTKIHQNDTLANLDAYRQRELSESYRFRAINRLDKDTSGIVVIAKDRYTASYLSGNVDKTYFAVCEGIINTSGTIDRPIKVMEGRSIQRVCADDGVKSVTHYKPLILKNSCTLLEINLETGRTHQIRTHFSSIGHPLLGDDMYGGSLERIERQALHCGEVSFIHPFSKEKIIIKSDLPNDMKKLTF